MNENDGTIDWRPYGIQGDLKSLTDQVIYISYVFTVRSGEHTAETQVL